MPGLTDAQWNATLDDTVGTTARTAPTLPMKLRMETVAGTATAAGTEATGYTPPTIAFSAAVNKLISNSGALSIAFTVAQTLVAAAVWDSAATPVRKLWGPLASNRTVAVGDSVAFAAGAIQVGGSN